MTELEVTEQFVAAINAHDVGCLASLITADHRFVDSLGTVSEGRKAADLWLSFKW
jgi:ketosteroid isomerase-like protein